MRKQRGKVREMRREFKRMSRCVEKIMGEREKMQWKVNVGETKNGWQRWSEEEEKEEVEREERIRKEEEREKEGRMAKRKKRIK